MGLMQLRIVTAVVIVMAGLGRDLRAQRWDGQLPPPAPSGPAEPWRGSIQLPQDPFLVPGTTLNEPGWVKFTIVPQPDGEQKVYFQNGHEYLFHYHFAIGHLEPFAGMTPAQFERVTLYRAGRKAVLGAVVVPPLQALLGGTREYGIQLVGHDPFTRQEVLEFFALIRRAVETEEPYRAFYFPTYEQRTAAETDRQWLEAQGIFISSTDRWADGNAVYSDGWALGTLKYFEGRSIRAAYLKGTLAPGDILLTDGVPAEVPLLAGLITLSPSTPNAHVAILAKTAGVPFVHLVLPEDVTRARELIGRRICLRAYDLYGRVSVRLLDTESIIDEQTVEEILALRAPRPLDVSPPVTLGAYGTNVQACGPDVIRHLGGKAANFGILRRAIPGNSPVALGLSFDLWSEFLDQPLARTAPIILGPGEHLLFWADGAPQRGRQHTNFRLSQDGEAIGLFDVDGITLLDKIEFGPQKRDVSYGRSVDGGAAWGPLPVPTPGQPNAGGPPVRGALVINEFMAGNGTTIENSAQPGEYSDWIELYNASDQPILLDGMYLTDDLSRPTKWQIPPAVSGGTLRSEIAQRLAAFPYPPADMGDLSATLAGIRALFTDAGVTSFTEGQTRAILSLLLDPQYGFDPFTNLRFRSSTNVEDAHDFTGAGLYDSFSGCLADDLDDTGDGPCLCDPDRSGKQGVFSAIRRVFASFYAENAYLARRQHNVTENDVGMAVLVHHSFPDNLELANGVALVKPLFGSSWEVQLVTQRGAVSVTNPQDGSIPEEVTVSVSPYGNYAQRLRPSNLVPLGGTVMTWEDDYQALAGLLVQVAAEFAATTGRNESVLEMEYKKVAPGGRVLPAGGLVVKQVRAAPQPDRTPSITPFLLAEPLQYCILQGEFGDVFANHRLKSQWQLETRSLWLTPENLGRSLYGPVTLEYLADGAVRTLTGRIDDWPGASYRYIPPAEEPPLLPDAPIAGPRLAEEKEPQRNNLNDRSEADPPDADRNDSWDKREIPVPTYGTTIDAWRIDDPANPRTCRLYTKNIPLLVSAAENPIWTLRDLREIILEVEYERPVVQWGWPDGTGGLVSATVDQARLVPFSPPSPDDLLQKRLFRAAEGVEIETSFYWPPPPKGPTAGYTAPLLRWVETRIAGYTSEPIVLRGYYAQTYRPGHHNFTEHFLFEPQLEPGLSPQLLAELRRKDIRWILVYAGFDGPTITTYGFDPPAP